MHLVDARVKEIALMREHANLIEEGAISGTPTFLPVFRVMASVR
jgi:hypothetical protein